MEFRLRAAATAASLASMSDALTPELEDLFSFLRFPSISTDSHYAKDVRACADWLIAKLGGMGLATEL